MILLTHIAIAMTSILFATLLLFSPSDFKFKANYLLLGATLASGTYLVVERGTHLMESCLMGLVYIGAISFALTLAKRKFARAKDLIER
jgi:hypothetical protein